MDNYQGDNNSDMHINGELRFLRDALANTGAGIVVFDVGANRGHWCQALLAINAQAQVHCFEPSKASWQELVRNPFPPNVVCQNVGLGDRVGKLKLYVRAPGSELNSLHPSPDLEIGSVEEVDVTTIDTYCRGHGVRFIYYLKIDVEGHDFAVLLGAEGALRERRIQYLQFEYGNDWISARVFLKDVFDFLKRFDYDIYKIMPDGLRAVNRYSTTLERFENANYLLSLRDGDITGRRPPTGISR